MDVEIRKEANVPIPRAQRGVRNCPVSAAIRELQPDKSIFLVAPDPESINRFRLNIASKICAHRKSNPDSRFTSRKYPDGVRVWRLADQKKSLDDGVAS